MRSGLESTSGGELWPLGEQRELGALRAQPSDGERSRHVDGVQHRDVAHPLGDSHEGTGEEHASVRGRDLAKPLGITLARWTRDPQGIYLGGNEMLMTPRQMIDARRAVSQSRPRRRAAGRAGRMGGRLVHAAHAVALGLRSRVRLRLVEPGRSTATAPASPGDLAARTSSSSAIWIWSSPSRRPRR